jgi:hypothetical protein
MDLKTLKHMTVTKLREEALKFDDLTGVHGMNKEQLIEILQEKFGIVVEKTESEELIERKHAIKAKMRKLKAEKAQAVENKDKEKVELLRKRLHSQRRVLRKVVKKAKARVKVD